MSLFNGPAEHADNPPETWQVVKAGRGWQLQTKDGGVLHSSFPTKREAESERTDGATARLYAKEARWYAGESIPGWRDYSEIRPQATPSADVEDDGPPQWHYHVSRSKQGEHPEHTAVCHGGDWEAARHGYIELLDAVRADLSPCTEPGENGRCTRGECWTCTTHELVDQAAQAARTRSEPVTDWSIVRYTYGRALGAKHDYTITAVMARHCQARQAAPPIRQTGSHLTMTTTPATEPAAASVLPSAASQGKPRTHSHGVPATIETFSQLRMLSTQFDGDGSMRATANEADAQHDNTRRAGFAAHMLFEYGVRTGECQPHMDGLTLFELVRDAVTDLRHFADAAGLDFDMIEDRARNAYRDDVLGQY
ncbi:hypothetical protein [Nocardia sp. NRRL S-836]|uniref:hypothetical protein n=1 Tax=Nocardia sp. NRRL S-836 TaxID=1519492 RepID=UPI0006AFC66A|nr:hypothetical protein [Nocardia sp. NRRL S-836]KOV84753.1 hypothetical protein ADL03_15935 [Nocardia sp. NRRL S-836]